MKISGLIKCESKVHDLTNHQILLEECRKREEVYAGVANLAIHMGSLGFHCATGEMTLPLHLPVILWIVYRLLRNMRRRKKLRAAALQRKLKLKKIQLRNVAIPTMLALLAPGLEHLGAVGLNELVVDLHGGPIGSVPIHVSDMPNILDGSGPIDGVQNQDFHLYGATTAALSGNNFCLASLVRLCS